MEYYCSVLIRWLVSRRIACTMQYLARPEVERNTALHKQREVIQLTRSTYCSSIPFIIYIDKEDKTHLRKFRFYSFQVSMWWTMFYN